MADQAHGAYPAGAWEPEVVPAAPPRALSSRQRAMYRFGFGLFVLAESMIFLTLISSRFLLAGFGHPSALDQALEAALTGIMAASLLPVRLAGRSAARGRMAPVPAYLLATALLGAVVVAGGLLRLGPAGHPARQPLR